MTKPTTETPHTSVLGAIWKNGATAGNLTTGQSEIQLQAECFQWTWNTFPATRKLIAHVPNGGSRNKAEASQLKASGVIAGVHDLFFYWKNQLYWFELKVGSNKQSDAQLEFGQAMVQQGAVCYEIRTFEAFKTIFLSIINN